MGYATKVQRINRKKHDQWYVGFPVAVAKAMEFVPSELVEWTIEDKATLVLRRVNPPASSLKKNAAADPRQIRRTLAANAPGLPPRAHVVTKQRICVEPHYLPGISYGHGHPVHNGKSVRRLDCILPLLFEAAL